MIIVGWTELLDHMFYCRSVKFPAGRRNNNWKTNKNIEQKVFAHFPGHNFMLHYHSVYCIVMYCININIGCLLHHSFIQFLNLVGWNVTNTCTASHPLFSPQATSLLSSWRAVAAVVFFCHSCKTAFQVEYVKWKVGVIPKCLSGRLLWNLN